MILSFVIGSPQFNIPEEKDMKEQCQPGLLTTQVNQITQV
uniref:Uncharacterized protein n=1 Tax=Brassica oleracea TaxID=3712 RepID=A0A3P6G3N4_BRAOL|nr:unnamed protein product [Brassica oleracea]